MVVRFALSCMVYFCAFEIKTQVIIVSDCCLICLFTNYLVILVYLIPTCHPTLFMADQECWRYKANLLAISKRNTYISSPLSDFFLCFIRSLYCTISFFFCSLTYYHVLHTFILIINTSFALWWKSILAQIIIVDSLVQ